MKTLKYFLLTETFVNIFPNDKGKRAQYAKEVFDVLQQAYAKIGGIQGKGFANPDDMIKNIPFWKLNLKDGKINALILYKDREGRKSVAGATDNTPAGKSKFAEMVSSDFSRSFGEKSGPMLKFVMKRFPNLVKKYAIPAKEAIEILTKGSPEKMKKFQLIPGEKYMYNRLLKDGFHAKMLIGTPGKKIIFDS